MAERKSFFLDSRLRSRVARTGIGLILVVDSAFSIRCRAFTPYKEPSSPTAVTPSVKIPRLPSFTPASMDCYTTTTSYIDQDGNPANIIKDKCVQSGGTVPTCETPPSYVEHAWCVVHNDAY